MINNLWNSEYLKDILSGININFWDIINSLNHQWKTINNYIIWWKQGLTIILKNLEYINLIITKYQIWGTTKLKEDELFLLQNIEEINKNALNITKKIYKDLFQYFIWKSFKLDDWISYIRSFWKISFLNNDFYKKENKKTWQKIMINIYILAVNYIISYYKWLKKFKDIKIENEIKKIDQDTKNLALSLLKKLKWIDSYENIYFNILLLLWKVIDIELFKQIVDNIQEWRIKSFDSAIKKLLKSPKYCCEFDKNWILWDQIWFLAKFESSEKLKNIAWKLWKLFQKWNQSIYKFNDRWVIFSNTSNKDTIKNIIPFVNIWIISDSWLIWEISLRYNEDEIIKEILDKYKKDNNIWDLIKHLINKIDYLNHKIYKLAQDIKIIRNFINEWIIKNTYLKSNAHKYVQKRVNDIVKYIVSKLEKLEPNIKDISIYPFVEYEIYKMLEQKLEDVIYELTYEKVVDDIKKSENYKKRKDKNYYIEWLKIKFIKKHKNNNSIDSLNSYTEEIKKIYAKFKREHKIIVQNSFFYNACLKLKGTSQKKIKTISNTTKDLTNIFLYKK